jgi:MFS family permease
MKSPVVARICLSWIFSQRSSSAVVAPRCCVKTLRIDGAYESDDLHLDGNKFNIALVVFYIPYIAIDIPSNWVVKRLQAGRYIPSLLIAWRTVSTFSGFAKSYAGLLAATFFLGLCGGGLLGGIIIYLAMFYRRHQLLYHIGLFYCAAPLSGAFGGLLATGLAMISVGDYTGMSWLFGDITGYI